jgi:hypothetical protein
MHSMAGMEMLPRLVRACTLESGQKVNSTTCAGHKLAIVIKSRYVCCVSGSGV